VSIVSVVNARRHVQRDAGWGVNYGRAWKSTARITLAERPGA
jgi:hypothetical protein